MTYPKPHPGDFGIPKEYWEHAQYYADYWRHMSQPAQKQHEFVHDPAEIRRVFEIDEADYPPPDSGFAKL